MEWIVGVGVIIALLVWSPALRKVALGIVALLAIGGGIFWAKSQKDDQRAATAIKLYEIELRDLRLGESYGSYKLHGTVKNNSPSETLSSVILKVTAQDCKPETTAERCETIGEYDTYLSTRVPPGQVRAVDGYVGFHNLPKVKGTFQWTYRVLNVKADVD